MGVQANGKETKKLPNGLPTYDNLPEPRISNFFGKDTEIQKINTSLTAADKGSDSSTGFPSVALHGLAGVGKSQIALEFAYRYMSRFPVILWVDSKTETSLQQSFDRIAVDLLPEADADKRVALLEWLLKTGKCNLPFHKRYKL